MEYIKAETVLPPELLREVQRYVDGRILYIPRAAGARRGWGEKTAARETLRARDEAIYRDYRQGLPADQEEQHYHAQGDLQGVFIGGEGPEGLHTALQTDGNQSRHQGQHQQIAHKGDGD